MELQEAYLNHVALSDPPAQSAPCADIHTAAAANIAVGHSEHRGLLRQIPAFLVFIAVLDLAAVPEPPALPASAAATAAPPVLSPSPAGAAAAAAVVFGLGAAAAAGGDCQRGLDGGCEAILGRKCPALHARNQCGLDTNGALF